MGETMSGQYRNSGYARVKRDYYPTPDVYIDWLFQHWRPESNRVHEPCAGQGHMARAIERHGFTVTRSDISTGADYLADSAHYQCVITNPPYERSLCPDIIRHALRNTDQCAFLLPYDWDAAATRADLFTVDGPFRMRIACNQRVKWVEGSKQTGMHNYAWFVWDIFWCGQEPVLRYAPSSGKLT